MSPSSAPVEGSCQACGSSGLESFYRVDGVPVHSCLMLETREEALAFPRGTLEIAVCGDCGFIQNRRFEAGRLHYSAAYEETQGFSPRFQRFASELCQRQVEKYALAGRTALEIGCGKGEFLVELCERSGGRGIGIDPSYRPERTGSPAAARIEFIRDLYSERYAHLRADYVCCRHTLEHIQPVREFVQTLRRTLDGRPDVVVFFEVPATERILEEGAFWDLYYEHCSYFTLGSLTRLFRSCDFEVLDLYSGFDDQYLMVEARPGRGAERAHLRGEDDLKWTRENARAFGDSMRGRHEELREERRRLRAADERTALWGSGSKAVAYLTTLGLTDEIGCVVDINPHKHGRFLAGTGHEIVAPESLVDFRPDTVIAMNGIYLDEIRSQLTALGLSPRLTAL